MSYNQEISDIPTITLIMSYFSLFTCLSWFTVCFAPSKVEASLKFESGKNEVQSHFNVAYIPFSWSFSKTKIMPSIESFPEKQSRRISWPGTNCQWKAEDIDNMDLLKKIFLPIAKIAWNFC